MPDRAKVVGVVAAGLAAITALWFATLMAIGFPWF
jgi:hypothetical protein